MSLFTVPLVINDGSADRTFNWLRQVPNEVAGLYNEPAAPASSVSRLKSQHTTIGKTGIKRHLVQRTEVCELPLLGTETIARTAAITVNLTVTHHPEAVASDVDQQVQLLIDAVASNVNFTQVLMDEGI